MTAAQGQEIIALVTDADPAGLKDKLAEYGAAKIVKLAASGGNVAASPDLQAEALAAAVEEFDLTAMLGTASAIGKDLFARLAALMDLPLVSDCVALDVPTNRQNHIFRQSLCHPQGGGSGAAGNGSAQCRRGKTGPVCRGNRPSSSQMCPIPGNW